MSSDAEAQEPEQTPAPHTRRRRRRLLFVVVMALGALLVFELGLRVVFAMRVGPRVLLYGTPMARKAMKAEVRKKSDKETVRYHENEQAGYSKYFPNEQRVDYDRATQKVFPVRINSEGFRGRDFEREKAPGVFRIVTLGASSTFGYASPDDETYPRHLERLLNAESPGRFEVINLGIPHLESHQILALFRAEALPLKPDLVTFYEGVNDSAASRKQGTVANLKQSVPILLQTYRVIRGVCLTVAFVDNLLTSRKTHRLTLADLKAPAEEKVGHFIESLTRLEEECRQAGITLVVANQQAKSYGVKEIRGVTYQEEVERTRARLKETGKLDTVQIWFLHHAELMKAQRAWARERKVPYVDVIGATDRRRDVLVSWVHLKPEGNRMVAEALAKTIRPLAARKN